MNSNFFFSPLGPAHPEVWGLIHELRPGLIRFPGGWESNHYDWETGQTSQRDPRRKPRKILAAEFLGLAKAQGFSVNYVLNVRDPIDKILRLLQLIRERDYPVVALELGNELYHERISKEVGGASGYVRKCVQIQRAIRGAGFSWPIGILIAPDCIPGKDKIPGFAKWNQELMSEDLTDFDALILHFYLPGSARKDFTRTYRSVLDVFRSCVADTIARFPGKDIWITEWNLGQPADSGLHNTFFHAQFVARLFVDILAEPRVTMANYHVLAGVAWELLGPDPYALPYVADLEKIDMMFRKKSVPLYRTVPFYALQALFAFCRATSARIQIVAVQPSGNLPVDLATATVAGQTAFVAVNPSDSEINIRNHGITYNSEGQPIQILAGAKDLSNGSFQDWKAKRRQIQNLLEPSNTRRDVIPPSSIAVFFPGQK